VELVYDAPADCPGKEQVIERIAALVQHRPLPSIAAKAIIARGPAGYRLELHVEGGIQHIVSQSCDSLVRTLSLILALAIDPQAQETTLPTNAAHSTDNQSVNDAARPHPDATSVTTAPSFTALPAPVATPPRYPERLRQPSPTPKDYAVTKQLNDTSQTLPVPASRAPTRVNLELHPTLLWLTEYGMFRSHLGHGPGLGLWIDAGDASLAVTAEWLLPVWAQMPDTSQPRGGHISFLGGEIEPCVSVSRARIVRACAGVEAGDMMGKGSGLSSNKLGHGIWLAAGGDISWRPKIWSHLGADLRAGFTIPMKRPAFGFDGYPWRFESEPWSVRLASGFSWF
jgi:hypothetical protein